MLMATPIPEPPPVTIAVRGSDHAGTGVIISASFLDVENAVGSGDPCDVSRALIAPSPGTPSFGVLYK
jgi:hypothetical protein